MKGQKKHIVPVAITFVALVLLLVIQVNWLVRAADLEEAIFSSRVEMAINKALAEIGSDISTSDSIKSYCKIQRMAKARENRRTLLAKVDSILHKSLTYYNITIKYSFDVIDRKVKDVENKHFIQNCNYSKCLSSVLNNEEFELKVHFPSRNQFIVAQLKGMFLMSVLLIILVSASFIYMLFLFFGEQKLAANTTAFVNNMTHEFKTPLTSISLANNMLRKEASIANSEKLSRYSQIIESEKNKLKSLVEEILEIACLENCPPKQTEPIDIHELISVAAESVRLSVEQRGGTMQLQLTAVNTIIDGNSNHISGAILNLMDNANKYSPDIPEICLKTYNEDHWLAIEITDKGIGISKRDQKLIFNKYYRVPTGDVHNVKGFGLGLTYVKMVADEHKGKINLKSNKGEGTSFTLYLPVK